MKEEDVRIEDDAEYFRLLKALAHPIRLQLLAVMGYKLMSPKEFALLRGESASKVSHHFRRLEELGFIELVRTRPVRGAIEHTYRRVMQVVFSDRDWLVLPDEARQIIASTTLRELVGHITEALQAGTITALPNPHIAWWRRRGDELCWMEMAQILDATHNAVEQAWERAEQRMLKSGDGGFEMTVALLGFESPPGASAG
jgi:DNA-binding transcriptional ArsR family regulator